MRVKLKTVWGAAIGSAVIGLATAFLFPGEAPVAYGFMVGSLATAWATWDLRE